MKPPEPKDIREVVYQILVTPGPRFNLEATARSIIRDYLARKFQAAIAANPECTEVLLALFTECCGKGGPDEPAI